MTVAVIYTILLAVLTAMFVTCIHVARNEFLHRVDEEEWQRRAVVYRDGRWWYAVPVGSDGSDDSVQVAWRGFRWLLVWRAADRATARRLVSDDRNRGIFFVEIVP